jgi:hypothetical protein
MAQDLMYRDHLWKLKEVVLLVLILGKGNAEVGPSAS